MRAGRVHWSNHLGIEYGEDSRVMSFDLERAQLGSLAEQ